jgi:hypothetical protein
LGLGLRFHCSPLFGWLTCRATGRGWPFRCSFALCLMPSHP